MAIIAAGLIILASSGLLVTLVLLVKELFPNYWKNPELIEELTKKTMGKVRKTTKKGQTAVGIADQVLKASQSFLNQLDLPPAMVDRSQVVMNFLAQYTVKADALVHHRGLLDLLSLVSPASGQVFGQSSDDYTYVITDDRNQPFQINQEIVDTAKKIADAKVTDEEKARAIFDWFIQNIEYGQKGWKRMRKRYRHAVEVFNDREGVCGEMAVLYVAMARSVGLQANYASVDIDFQGDKVNHACASVQLRSVQVSVDPAYFTFDVRHRDFKVLTDQEAVPHFKAMRG